MTISPALLGVIASSRRINVAGAYYTAIMGQTPAGYWRQGNASGTTMTDSSGNARHGTYTGSPTLGVPGLDGSTDTAATFVANTSYGRVTYGSWMNSSNFSMSLILTVGAVSGSLVGRRLNSAANTHWSLRANAGSFVFSGTASQFSFSLITGNDYTLPTAGTTLHLGMTYAFASGANGTLSLFHNGLLILKVNPQLAPNITGHANITVAGDQNNAGETINEGTSATIDEYAFFTSALTAAQIKAQAAILGYNTTEPTFDSIGSTARAIYELRAVNGYSGSLLDVRRSSDNATRTIGIVSGELDTADLLTWAGSTSVFVSRWYDQSGNSHHMDQATSGSQPRIVNAGTLETQNSKPAINFVTNTWLMESTSLIGTGDSCTLMMSTDAVDWTRGEDGFGNGWSIAGSGAVVFTRAGAASYNPLQAFSTSFSTRISQISQIAANSSELVNGFNGVQQSFATVVANDQFRTSTRGLKLARGPGGASTPGKVAAFMVWRTLPHYGKLNAIHNSWSSRFGY